MNLKNMLTELVEFIRWQPFEIGKRYYIRAVTYHFIGKVEKVGLFELVISDPIWVADSGKWCTAYDQGTLADAMVSPPFLVIGRLSIVDAGLWPHEDTSSKVRRV